MVASVGAHKLLQKEVLDDFQRRLLEDLVFASSRDVDWAGPSASSHRSSQMLLAGGRMNPVQRTVSMRSFQNVVLVAMLVLARVDFVMFAGSKKQRREVSSGMFGGSRCCSIFALLRQFPYSEVYAQEVHLDLAVVEM